MEDASSHPGSAPLPPMQLESETERASPAAVDSKDDNDADSDAAARRSTAQPDSTQLDAAVAQPLNTASSSSTSTAPSPPASLHSNPQAHFGLASLAGSPSQFPNLHPFHQHHHHHPARLHPLPSHSHSPSSSSSTVSSSSASVPAFAPPRLAQSTFVLPAHPFPPTSHQPVAAPTPSSSSSSTRVEKADSPALDTQRNDDGDEVAVTVENALSVLVSAGQKAVELGESTSGPEEGGESRGTKRSVDEHEGDQEQQQKVEQSSEDVESKQDDLRIDLTTSSSSKRRRTGSASPAAPAVPPAPYPALQIPSFAPMPPVPTAQPVYHPYYGYSPVQQAAAAHYPSGMSLQRHHDAMHNFLANQYYVHAAHYANQQQQQQAQGQAQPALPSYAHPPPGSAEQLARLAAAGTRSATSEPSPAPRRDADEPSSPASTASRPGSANSRPSTGSHAHTQGTSPSLGRSSGYQPQPQPYGSPPIQHQQVSTSPTAMRSYVPIRPTLSPQQQAQQQHYQTPQPNPPLISNSYTAPASSSSAAPGGGAGVPVFGAAPATPGYDAAGVQAGAEQEEPRKKGARGKAPDNAFEIDSLPGVKPFIAKLRFLLNHPEEVGDSICWSESGNEVLVKIAGETRLVDNVLPRTFYHTNLGAFYQGQFTAYGFVQIKDVKAANKALRSPRPAQDASTAATGSDEDDDDDEPADEDDDDPNPARPYAEWRVYAHRHTHAEFLAARQAEREQAAKVKAVRQSVKRSAEDGEGASEDEEDEEESEEGEKQEEVEDPAQAATWFARSTIDDVVLLRRLKAKSKAKDKDVASPVATGAGGAAAGQGGGGAAPSSPAQGKKASTATKAQAVLDTYLGDSPARQPATPAVSPATTYSPYAIPPSSSSSAAGSQSIQQQQPPYYAAGTWTGVEYPWAAIARHQQQQQQQSSAVGGGTLAGLVSGGMGAGPGRAVSAVAMQGLLRGDEEGADGEKGAEEDGEDLKV
ncbi:hypothetical protein JCM8097_008232 [Rhodosporidiobolus ruineniae]